MTKIEMEQRVRTVCRVRRLSLHTEESYLGWIRRFAGHVKSCGDVSREEKVRLFLERLAARSSASTQNQALNAVVFFYRDVMKEPLRAAAHKCGLTKRVTAHTLRHSFATNLLAGGASITQVQELLGHNSVETTQVYLHCVPRFAESITSPLDAMPMPENVVKFERRAVAA
jgi:site-specific recombinase XerD